MSLELEVPIALTAKLQAAEARALAAEMRLKRISDAINDDVTSFTDALSIAEGVIADSDLTAAREMMRKADSFDDIYEALPDDSPAKFPETGVSVLDEVKDLLRDVAALRAERDEAQQRLRAAIQERMKTFSERPDFDTFVALKHGVVGAVLQALQDGIISRGKACEALAEVAHGAEPTFKASDVEPLDEDCIPAQEVRQLRTERDELAALVEAILTENEEDAEFVAKVIGDPDDCHYPPAILRETVAKCRALTPPAALAALRHRVRVEVLEEVAKLANEKAVSLMRDSAKAHEDNCPIMGRARLAEARLFDFFAAKIRVMKEAQ